MTEDDLELVLDVQFKCYPRVKKATPWFKNKKHLEGVVEALAGLPLFKDLKVAGLDDKLKPFQTIEAVKALVAIGRDEWTYLQSSKDGARELWIVLQPTTDELGFKIFCSGRLLKKHSDTIVDQYITATQRVRDAMGDIAGIFMGFAYPHHLDGDPFRYSRPRPPRSHPVIPMQTVADLVDVRFHTSKHPDAQPEEVRGLTASRPPKPARRIEEHGFVALQWATNATPSELRRAASQREVWIPDHLPMLLEEGFNEQGDLIENPGKGALPKPPLTLYSPKFRTGYKAVVVFPDGSIEQHAWQEAKKVLKKKALADRSRVDELMIVVPLRKHVFMISDAAKKAGFAGVVYPGNDGTFWHADPPGLWLTPPIGAPKTTAARARPRTKSKATRAAKR